MSIFGITTRDELKKEAQVFSEKLGYPISPDALSGELNAAGQGDVRDAFRHAYASAVLTYEAWASASYVFGDILGEKFGGNPEFLAKMDIDNNALGREVGNRIKKKYAPLPSKQRPSIAQIKQEIAQEVADSISHTYQAVI